MANSRWIIKPMSGIHTLKTTVTRLIVLTLLAFVGWGVIASPGPVGATPNLQTQCVALSLQPPSRTVNIGDIFTLDVRLDAGSASFDTASLDIRFDPAILVVVDASGNPSSSIQQGNLNSTGSTVVASNSVDNTAGSIAYAEALLGYSQTGGTFTVATSSQQMSCISTLRYSQTGGTFTVATVRFKAKQATSGTSVTFANIGNTASPTFTGILFAGSTIAFCTGSPAGATVIVSGPTTGTPTPTATPTRTPTPTSTPITGWRRVYLPLILKKYPPPPPTGTELVGHIGGTFYDVKVAGSRAYVAAGAGLYILDVSTPSQPSLLGKLLLPYSAKSIHVVWPYAYVVDDSGLRIIDVSSPANPREVGFYGTSGTARDVYVAGGYAYVVGSGLWIVNVSNPSNPQQVSFYASGAGSSIHLAGSYVYVAGVGLKVIDVMNPSTPQQVGFNDAPGSAEDIYVAGSYAYLADSREYNLWIIDISNPASPQVMGFWSAPARIWNPRGWGLRLPDG